MDIQKLLDSRTSDTSHWTQMMRLTDPHSAYPGKLPAGRDDILFHLEELNLQTAGKLDTLASSLRSSPCFSALSPAELYLLRQRLRCALDILARLADSQPTTPGWLSIAGFELEQEDRWLLAGLWREFGTFWLQNLSWRLSHGSVE
jgi:hypothetical protein